MVFDGVKETLENFERLDRALFETSAVRDAFLPAAQQIRDRAKSTVRVRTGLLRDSIFATTGPNLTMDGGSILPNVIVGVSLERVPYAAIVEYSIEPYLRPAELAIEASIEETVGARLDQVITEAVK